MSGRLLPVLVITLTLTAYLSGLHGAFTYDDYYQILFRDKLHNIFNLRDVIFCELRQNRLWQNLSIALNWTLTPKSTVSFKLFGLGFHLLNTFILHLWLKRLLKNHAPLALITSLIFMVHPLQIQSVTYAMGVISLFQGFFYLISLYWYERFGTQRMIGLSIILILSLFAKETCVLIPLMLLLYEVIIKGTAFKSLPFRRWAILFAIPLLYIPLHLVLKDPVSMYEGTTGFSLYPKFDYIYSQAYYLSFLTVLFLNPTLQSIIHGVPGFTPFQILAALAGGLIWFTAPVLFLKRVRKNPLTAFFLAFFFLNYLPTNSFFQMVNPFAEYRLYLCLIPLSALLGHFIIRISSRISGKWSPNAKALVPVAFMSYFATHTFIQVQIWRDEIKIYSQAVKRYPFEDAVYYSLAMAYLHVLDLENAYIYLVQCRIHSGFMDARLALQFYQIAGLHYKNGNFDRAWSIMEYVEKEKARVTLPKQFYDLREMIEEARSSLLRKS